MKKKCATCGGTGQIGFFQGVSRFLLSWEECPGCCGTGFTGDEAAKPAGREKKVRGSKSGRGKKKKS